MNSKSMGLLALVTVLVIALAYFTMRSGPTVTTGPKGTGSPAAGTGTKPSGPGASPAETTGTAFPALGSKANDAASIRIKSIDKEVTVAKDAKGIWVVSAKHSYPADFEKVRNAIVSLQELSLVEAKTQKPENYAFLGVTDPADVKDSPARVVTVTDAGGAVLAAAYIGNTTTAAGAPRGESRTGVYFRRQGEAQAYQGEGRLDPRQALDPDPVSWLKKDVVSVDSSRVRRVVVTQRDGTKLVVEKDSKETKDFAVKGIPEGRELTYGGAATPTAGALAAVNFDDVMPVAEIGEGATPGGSAEYFTWDGLIVTVETSSKDGTGWATFAARFEAPPADANADDKAKEETAKRHDEVRKEAEALNAKVGAWAYALPEFKMKQFQTKIEELLKPLEAKTDSPSLNPGPVPGGETPVLVPEK